MLRIAETLVATLLGTVLVVRVALSVFGVLPGFLNSPLDVVLYVLLAVLFLLMAVDQAKRLDYIRAGACAVAVVAWSLFAILIAAR
ncbi:hypothetical protein [Leifsonia xyli]|uniref:hypothetical protein n=1 Tax=Leifsonia xyli TaxID=1575 RepID=UPI003D672822